MSESLFSLELHVESVARVKVSCVIPAVSFRLLDYPTLIIHLVSPSSIKKLLEKTRIHGIPKEHVESELRDRYGNIPFQKGKSCLFKASISSLQHQLESTPLYVMLIDLWHKKPKLVGSTVISLSDAISKISSDVKKFGISNPSVSQDEGMFDVFNLMGTVVGKIQLSFRLMSLGGSLMPHVPTKSIMSRKGEEKTQEKDINSKENVCLEVEDVDVELNCDVKLREKNLELESESTLQHSETQTDKPVPTAYTHEIRQDKKQTPIKDTEEDVIPMTNTVCPPPLFYNFSSHAENGSNKRTERQGQKETHHSRKNYVAADDDVDFIYYKPGLLKPDGSTGCASVCIQTEDLKTESTVVSFQGNNDRKIDAIEKRLDSEDLPLLNALLEELTYLRTRKQGPRPSDSRTDKPPKENVLRYNVQKVPRTRECCLQVAAQKALSSKNKKRSQHVVPKKVKFKQTSLTYGTTRTQLMRLEMHQQGKLKSAAKFRSVGSKDKKTLSDLHTHSRQSRPKMVKELVHEDLEKTHTIFTSPGAEQEGKTVSPGEQTDDGPLELTLTSEPKTTSDSEGEKSAAQTLENKASLKILQKEDIQPDVGNSSTRSLASQNSLDVYLPQVEGDSDGGSSFGSDDVPLPELPVTVTTKYGHTGIHSPDLPEPIRRPSFTSPPVRSRTSTALSMYSDDFEESLIWEAEDESENDNSDTASISSLSASSSQVKNKKISPSVSSEVSVDYSHPLKSDFSPQKSKKLIQKESASSLEESEFNEETSVDVPDVMKESLFDSLNSTNSDYTLKKDRLDDGSTSIQQDSDENKSILQLPRPAVDLGYTY